MKKNDWAVARVQETRRSENILKRLASPDVVVADLADDECAEQAATLLKNVKRALLLRRPSAYVRDMSSREVVQVSGTRAFEGGRRWCVVVVEAKTATPSLTWYFTLPHSGQVCRDGVGPEGQALRVQDAYIKDIDDEQQFRREVRTLFLGDEPIRLSF